MSLLGGSLWAEVDRFLLFNQTYVLGNVRPELFFLSIVVGHLCLLFLFSTTDIHAFIYLTFFFFFFLKGIFHLGVLIYKTHTSRLHVIYRMGVRLLFFICWMQFWDYEHLMYTLNILLLNVTGLNSAVKEPVLEYLHRKSISGALICNTASSGIFSQCVLGVSCGHGSVDVLYVDLVLSSSLRTNCFADTCVSSWNLMQRRRLFAGFAAARRTMM